MKEHNKQPLSALLGMNKTARVGAISAAVTLLLLIVLIVVNSLMGLLPSSIASPAVTNSNTFRISGTTLDWLKSLNEDVTLYFICKGGKANADGDLYAFLERYTEANGHIRLEVVDSASDSAFITNYGGEWPSDMSVIVSSAARYRVIDNTDLYYYYFSDSSSGTSMTMTPEEYTSYQEYFASADSTGAYLQQLIAGTTAYFDGESRVTNAINYVTQDEVAVAYMLTGNGATELDSRLSSTLSQSCYDLRTTLTIADLPADCDILIINAPESDLSEEEAAALSTYLANCGKLFLTTFYGYGKLPNLSEVLSAYGLGFEASMGYVCEGNPNYYFGSSSYTYNYIYKAHISSDPAATGDFGGEFVGVYAHAIATWDVENVTVTPWLYTSEAGYLQVYNETTQKWETSNEKAVYTFGAIAESGDTQIIWVSTPSSFTQTYNSYASGGNFELLISAFNSMSGIGNDGITVSSTAIESSYLSVSAVQFAVWGIVLVIVLPIAVAVVGVVIWYSRKKR